MNKLKVFVESRMFQIFILVVILGNAVLFGLQTSHGLMAQYGSLLNALDRLCLMVFVVELALKIVVYNRNFCKDGWNLFDSAIVAISFMPDMGMLSSARIFRVLRVFKLISGIRHLRVILEAILRAIPGIMWAGVLLGLIYYVYAILGTNFFGQAFPQWFGTLGESTYTLFQVMTLESWSMGIARPVVEKFPCAWIFFVSYILFTAFIVMNVVVGIVLNSISESFQQDSGAKKVDSLEEEWKKLKAQMEVVDGLLKDARSGK